MPRRDKTDKEKLQELAELDAIASLPGSLREVNLTSTPLMRNREPNHTFS